MSNESGAEALSQESLAPDQNNAESSVATENVEAGKIADMQKRLDGQSATISRMERMLKGIAESQKAPEPSPTPAEPKGKGDDFEAAKAELMAMKADIEAKAQATRDKQKRHLIVSELQTKGLEAIAAEEAYLSISAREGDKLKLAEDESSVFFQGGEFDDPTPISNFVESFLSSDRGRLYAPRKSNPNSGNRATGTDSAGTKYITKEQLKTLSPAELKSGNFTLKD
jgi:hypothetical protein